MNKKLLLPLLILSTCRVCDGQETTFKLCKAGLFSIQPLALKVTRDGCQGCNKLENCTTYEGSIQIRNVRQHVSEEVMRQFYFPKLTEITGYLLISLVYGIRSLKDVFPNLAVIRGWEVFLDYSLVVYENDGLEELNLPALTTIMNGGVRIEKNINLCYVETVRWKSIMKTDADEKYAPVLSSNNNDCYDICFQPPGSGANKICDLPAGHGSSAQQYCWGPGNAANPECQQLCDLKCGNVGCLQSTKCCHKECLGGCSVADSPKHCHACQHFRMPKSGECVERCPSPTYEIDGFKCVDRCSFPHSNKLGKKCVKECPAGYKREQSVCVKCLLKKCPKQCKTKDSSENIKKDDKPPIDSMESLLRYKECTEINGNLIINMRGSGGSGIGKKLEENLGKIEKVKGYIMVRESASLVSLNFFKNLKKIQPKRKLNFDGDVWKKLPDLYNHRYALVILDNPKLEALWPIQQNLSITDGGIMVHLNPYLCPDKIRPLQEHMRRWSQNYSSRHIDISQTTNGIAVACDVEKINVTLKEVKKPSGRRKCNAVCMKVEWDEVSIQFDYRNVLFYTVSYREVPNRKITEYDGADAGCGNGQVWTRVDVTVNSPQSVNVSQSGSKVRKLVKYVDKLKPFTLYAFQVEAVVLKNKGAKSDLVFIQTKEEVPSVPVGLEATDINSSALLVTWQPPLFPNGNITKYIVTYNLSSHSPWKRDLNWCNREVFSNRHTADKEVDDGNAEENPNGKCPKNITCDCDKDKNEQLVPEKKAALFAKEFQDTLYKTIFTKKDDNDDEKAPNVRPTTPTTVANRTNCTNLAQNSSCYIPTTSTMKTTVASKESSKSPLTGTPKATVAPTKSSSTTTLIVDGSVLRVVLGGLKYFTDYTITVCACTKAGCANESSCAITKGRTFKNETADNLGGPLTVTVDNKTKMFRLSWKHPKEPNGVVLKFEIEIKLDSNSTVRRCRKGKEQTYQEKIPFIGSHAARVRTITPAGNGSWSNTVLFTWEKEDTKFPEEKDAMRLGTVVGVSLAASVVFVLACGFVLWYIAHKRYIEKQIPGVLYASVNPEYRNATDVYIADEWEVPRDKIKLIRELGNGSFGMVYEGEADIIPDQPPQRVAVKTVSENASILDRVEFLQEASVMKAFDSNHVVRLMGVVSDGQPTLVIMELMENGDLKNFLRCRRPGEGSLPPPTLQELLQMAGEIADGMAYLAARKYVHRDLAARNCMVNHNFTVKIGDFGMTRDIYETDYYRKGGKGLLPVRWMAPESLKDGVFTSYSDVWSFGVVMWEMATLASQPYPGKSNEEVLKHVVDGGLMEKPDECPDRLFELMTLCWKFNPKSRPTFVYLISCLESDLSPSFRELSFYHTLPPGQLEGLLNSHCKHRNRTGTTESRTNIESSA